MDALNHWEMLQIVSNLIHAFDSELSSTQKQNGLDLLSKLSYLKGMLWCLAEIFSLWQKNVKVKLGFNETTRRNNTGKNHLNIMDRWVCRCLVRGFNVLENGYVYCDGLDISDKSVVGKGSSWKGTYTGCSLDNFTTFPHDDGRQDKGSAWPGRYDKKVISFINKQ